MNIFISWSGDRSRLIAEAIRVWLPKVMQSVKPWMSDQDISAGARWLTEVSSTLNTTSVGLICVTPENQHNPWLLFEAGALSKTIEQTCVCPIVFEMTPGQLDGPLTQFQANNLDRIGIGKVLTTINSGLGDRRLEAQQLEEILDVWWPKLEEKLNAIPAASMPTAIRTTGDQLEELLALSREQLRRENIRIEASNDRDEKLDSLLGFLDKMGASISTFQLQAQRAIAAAAESALANSHPVVEGESVAVSNKADALKGLAGVIGPGKMDLAAMQQMTKMMREMQERDKERARSMLSGDPPLDSSN
ncbi:MAG: toll/interleukin-1 receptor domain-containing protein [Rhodocyclales bacterium]|nr:toll/interleukin-1 receptor domain-containing protein [Rhodocyclales bacterium]